VFARQNRTDEVRPWATISILISLVVLSSCLGCEGLGILASFVSRIMQLKGVGIQLVCKIRSIGLR
jgi:hypothetical protein